MASSNMPLPSSSGGTDFDEYTYSQMQKMQQAHMAQQYQFNDKQQMSGPNPKQLNNQPI